MKRVLTAVVLIPLVLLAVFRAPMWLFALLIAGLILLALNEYLAIAEAAGTKPFKWLTYVVAMLPVVGCFVPLIDVNLWHYMSFGDYGLMRTMQAVLLLAPLIFGIALVLRKDLVGGLSSVAASVLGVLYVACSLLLLISLRLVMGHQVLVIFVLFSVWAGDIAAYYVGRGLGRRKLAPVVSPNKSWEGAIASVVGSVLIAFLVFRFFHQIDDLFSTTGLIREYWLFLRAQQNSYLFTVPWAHVLILGIVTNVAAQFGDLFESALKRGANLKDSGTLLPGHGGVLDRIDALLFAIPVVWYYANLTQFLQPKPF
jgi:phosphatidate cytidylyltransferase